MSGGSLISALPAAPPLLGTELVPVVIVGAITGITQAASAVVTINTQSATNPFAVGQDATVSGIVGGMAQINLLHGVISAIGGVSGAWTVTLPINTTAFSAYVSGGQLTTTVATVSGNLVLYLRTAAETAAAVIPVNYAYAPGVVDRYGTNTTPGTTDMSAAFTAANSVWVNGGPAITLQNATYLVSSALTIAAPIIFTAPALLKPSLPITLNGAVTAPPVKIFSLPSTGGASLLGLITGGSGYANGTYTNVPLTGGSGTGAQATITVAGGAVTNAILSAFGSGYSVGNALSASNANLGGAGSGFSVPVNAVAQILGSLGGVGYIPHWWGALADGNFATGTGTDNSLPFSQMLGSAAARSAQLGMGSAANEIHIPAGVYKQSTAVSIGDGLSIRGAGMYQTIIFVPAGSGDSNGIWQINGQGTVPTTVKRFALITQFGGANGSGLVCTKNGTFISEVWAGGFTTSGAVGIMLGSSDNFLTDSVAEINYTGIYVHSNVFVEGDVTIANCRSYQNETSGLTIVNTGTNPGYGRILVTNFRSTDDAISGVLVSASKRVSLIGVDCATILNNKFSSAAIQVDSASDDILLSGCTGTKASGGGQTAPGILLSASNTNVTVDGCAMKGFYDGLQVNGGGPVNVTGGQYWANSRNGVLISGGSLINVTGVQCSSNGAAGIDSENTAANGWHNIAGNSCNGNATNGILANLTSASAFTNVQSNQARGNTGTNISYTGTTANINQGAAPTNF